jgi:predicted ATPase with chaperone activity
MVARRLTTILPDMTLGEAIDTTVSVVIRKEELHAPASRSLLGRNTL